MMSHTELREWAKQELDDALVAWMREMLNTVFTMDERHAIETQANIARRAVNYRRAAKKN